MAVATAAVPAPAPPPWGGTGDRTPEPAGGCLYTNSPRGRPGARRWPWVLFGGGVQPGQWRGSPRGSGGLAVQQGAQPPRHCGSPSHRVRPAWRPADPPPPEGRWSLGGSPEGAQPVGGPTAAGGPPAPDTEGPLPQPADPGAHCGRAATETPCKQGAAYPPQLTRASERAMAGGGGRTRSLQCPAGHTRRGWWWARRQNQPRQPPPWCGPSVRTPDLAGGCLYAHSPRGRPRARRWH